MTSTQKIENPAKKSVLEDKSSDKSQKISVNQPIIQNEMQLNLNADDEVNEITKNLHPLDTEQNTV